MNQTLHHIKKYFTVWWIPITTNLIALGIFFLGMLFRRDWIIDFSLIVFLLNSIGTIISSTIQIVNRKWYFIFPQLGLLALMFYYIGILFMYSPPDFYGTHKTIPKNIEFSYPLDSIPSENEFKKHDLILLNDFQPGIYIYYTDYTPTELGYFYVKAFEINSNDQLSEERMQKRSQIKVDNLKPQRRQGEFTIYEGDWGDKYASRIELWYKPAHAKEYKVDERNFIIEGWQR